MTTAWAGGLRETFGRVRDRAAGAADGELLGRFLAARDEAAFGQLVRRHGPMVLGVCRRVLGDHHAAEDAFQATFLVLAKKADAVRPPGVLGAWLYGVAYRTALKARGRDYRRRQVEHEYAENRPAPPADGHPELLRAIDQQVTALPEKYRLPLVLCGVQGLGKAEAAERLGLPEGTVSSRLARAREMLRDRLTRRGVIVPAAVLAALLVPRALHAAVAPGLSVAATELATGVCPVAPDILTLSHEALTAMTLSKWKLLSAIAVAVALAGSGVGLFATADEKKPGQKPAADKPAAAKPGEKPAKPGEKPAAKPDGEKPAKPGEKPARPDGEKPVRKPARMVGRVGKVDAAANTIVLIRKGDAGVREDVLNVAADAAVTIDGKAAKLADLKPDMNVEALLAGEGKAATEVRASGPKFTGVVKALDATSVTVGNKEGTKSDRVIKLAPGGKVLIDGKLSKLSDLQTGDKAGVVMAADDSGAVMVVVSTKGDGDNPKKPGGDKPKPDGEKKPVKPGVKPNPAKPGEKPATKPDGEKKPMKPQGEK